MTLQINGSGDVLTLSSASTAAMVYTPDGTGAVNTTVQAKLRESVSVNDFWSGAGDTTTATQAAITAATEIKFLAGQTYNLTGDISIPANRKIIVEKGATVINTGGRFTAYNVDNVEWVINGTVRSVSMATAPAKTGWPSIANGYYGDERGFIEFGGASTTAPCSGFSVTGSGIVSGDWTGTAAVATSADVNFKGIATFNCKNVHINISEVYGFRGEAVYFWGISINCVNVVFEKIYSHDSKFNALNFNVVGPEYGLLIKDCTTLNCYAGIELSGGEAYGNTVISPLTNGIWTGVGSGGKTTISRNVVRSAGAIGIYAGWSSLMSRGVTVSDNSVIDSGTFGILCTFSRDVTVIDNTVRGHSTTGAGYGIQVSDSDYGQVTGNTIVFPGTFSSGTFYTTFNTTNLLVGENSDIPTATTPTKTREYIEGTFTPVPTNLTIVGSANYAGAYTRIGRLVHWAITITPVGAGTTASTISSTTFTGLSVNPSVASTCQAATSAIAQLQNGYVTTGGTIWAPTWIATNAVVTLTGTYQA